MHRGIGDHIFCDDLALATGLHVVFVPAMVLGSFLSTWSRCLSGIVCGAALSIARALRPILFSCCPLLLRCLGTFTKLASSCSRNAKKVFHKAKAGELFPEVPDRLAVGHIVRDGQVQKAHETKAVAYLKLRRVIRDVVVALKDQDFEHQQVIIGSPPPCLWPAWLVHPSKAPEGLKINVLTQALQEIAQFAQFVQPEILIEQPYRFVPFETFSHGENI